MSNCRTVTPGEAYELRITTGIPNLDSITVYDADFPIEAGQQFVQAVLRSSHGLERTVDLTDEKHEHLSRLLHAAADGETVKFALELPDPHPVDQVVGAGLEIENYYSGDVVHTTATALLPLPIPEDDDERNEWEQDWIFPYTGTGQTEGDSAYFVTIASCDDPSLVGREFEFGV